MLVALIGLTALAAFAAGYFALSYRLAPRTQPQLWQVDETLAGFRRRYRADSVFRLDDLMAPARRAELLDPFAHLPQSARYDYGEISRLYRYAGDCALPKPPPKNNPSLAKAWTWHRFLCGERSMLPAEFFESGPATHPSGSSYVYLAWKSGRAEFSGTWGKAYLPLMHAAEYAQLPAQWLDPARRAVAPIDSAGLRALLDGERIVLAGERVLIRTTVRDAANGDTWEASGAVYEVRPTRALEKFLRDTTFALAPVTPGAACLLRDGNACWSYNLDGVYRRARAPTLSLLAVALALTALFALLLFHSLRAQRLEERQKRFALQTLTHELRTPIASLRVSTETLRARIDAFPPDAQEATLRILDDLQRLNRLTEASRQYLSAFGGALIRLERAPLGSVAEFVGRVLEPWLTEIVSEGFREDVVSLEVRLTEYLGVDLLSRDSERRRA